MLQWAFSACLISVAALAFLVASSPPWQPSQPIQFSHKVHLDYFRDGRHRQSMVSMHEEMLEDYKDGSHGRSMVSMHRETLMKALEDEEIVGELIVDVEKGVCTKCHGDFDRNAQNLLRLDHCAACHRRKEQANEEFSARMILDIEEGHCTKCHGDFDRNVKDPSRLSHCAECHRVFVDHNNQGDWQGQSDPWRKMRPCMGCHSGVVQSPMASIPNINTCAACHPTPLQGDHGAVNSEEAKLLVKEFIEQERTISWARVYDYLPGEIVFSHERHVALGHVMCQECHGPVEQAERPLSLDVKLRMEDCMICHASSGADNDCLACHK